MKPSTFTAFVSFLIGTAPLQPVAALGLGEATLRSHLNERLQVEIVLVGRNFEADAPNATIRIARAHVDTGTPGTGPPSGLRAEVSITAPERARVLVSSDRFVRDPVVTFVLVVENARERVMREYTLLVDPPGYALPTITASAGARAPPDPTSTIAEVTRVTPEPRAASPVPVPERAPAIRAPVAISPTPGTRVETQRIAVTPGDTLSKLAMRLRKAAGVTWAQMTWALYEANPDAFIDGDINRLRANVHLRVPPPGATTKWSHREALALVRGAPAPTSLARTATPKAETESSSPAITEGPSIGEAVAPSTLMEDATSSTADDDVAEPASEQRVILRLLSPDNVDELPLDGDVSAPLTELERERIRQLMEQADQQIQQSNEEMAQAREQLVDATQRISTLFEEVAEKDSQIQGLESRLADLREITRQQSLAMAQPESRWVHRILFEVLLLAASVGVLAVALSRWTTARRRQWAGSDVGAVRYTATSTVAASSQPPSVDDDVPTEILVEEVPVDPSYEHPGTADDAQSSDTQRGDDPLVAANAYFAYGYYEKAREVLTEVIKERPAHAEARLLMLRVLHAIREKRTFRRHAEALLELVDSRLDERWVEVSRLGRSLFPDARLFNDDIHKRADDSKWEETVWTGIRPDLDEQGDQVYLDVDEFKYVDLLLIDEANDDEQASLDASARPDAANTEAELARWQAEMAGDSQDRGFKHERVEPEETSEIEEPDERRDDSDGDELA